MEIIKDTVETRKIPLPFHKRDKIPRTPDKQLSSSEVFADEEREVELGSFSPPILSAYLQQKEASICSTKAQSNGLSTSRTHLDQDEIDHHYTGDDEKENNAADKALQQQQQQHALSSRALFSSSKQLRSAMKAESIHSVNSTSVHTEIYMKETASIMATQGSTVKQMRKCQCTIL